MSQLLGLSLALNRIGGIGIAELLRSLNNQAWFDASDPSTIQVTGSLVDQWNDKSGNGNHATATLTDRPTTGSETLNGMNVISGDGGNLMTFNCSLDPTKPIYVFQVSKFTATTDCFCDFTGSSIRLLVTTDRTYRDTVTNETITFGTDYTLSTAKVSTFTHLNDVSKTFICRENSIEINSQTYSTTDNFSSGVLGTGYIFDDSTGGNALSGYMAEYAVLNPTDELTESELLQIENYLKNKWVV